MRRIIHNTTAIAACLSLLAPHLAMAQTETPAADTAEQAAPAPETCADGSALPCATEPAAEAEAVVIVAILDEQVLRSETCHLVTGWQIDALGQLFVFLACLR